MTEETKKHETQEKHEHKHEEKHHVENPVEKIGKKLEREFIIPLRSKFEKTASYRRTPKAIRAIKEYLVRHMKMYDRDLKKIKIDKYLNEFMWTRGIKNPPIKIKVKAFVDGEFVRVELSELSKKLGFKKGKMEKREKRAAEIKPKKQDLENLAQAPEKTEEQKSEEKEKKAAVVEAGQKMEKIAGKAAKHQTKISKQPKHQKRMALAK